MGHEVSSAESGEKGLELLGQPVPDLVLCDLNMPGLNGFEVARRIKEQAALQNIKLVALTGYGGTNITEQAKVAEFDDHLVKPVEMEKLEGLLSS
jgi:CheY-like chemotaxis protein